MWETSEKTLCQPASAGNGLMGSGKGDKKVGNKKKSQDWLVQVVGAGRRASLKRQMVDGNDGRVRWRGRGKSPAMEKARRGARKPGE